MDKHRTDRRCTGHATRLIERRERLAPAEFSFVRSQAPRTRLLFISALSLCPALLMAWAGVGLPRFLEPRAAFAAGTTRYVSNDGGGDSSNDCATNINPCKTIQHAVDQSAPGDAILVAGGVYTGLTQHLGLPFLVFISITLSIQGGYTTTDSFAISDPVASPTILDAERGGYNIFFFGTNGDFSNLTVQNGNVPTGFGGGIFALQGNALTLTHVTVISNTAESGGGISADGRVVMRDVIVMSNTAVSGGGGALVEGGSVPGVLMLDGGVFQNNNVNAFQSAGAGLEVQGTLTLSGTQFLSNTVHGAVGGGGVYASGAVTITGGRFRNNDGGSGLGGGLYAVGPLVMSDTQFVGNVARRGGGAAVQYAATLAGGLFQNNISSEDIGGGLYAFGTTVLTGTQFLSNTAAEKGGGLYAQDTLVLTGTRFLGNTASQGGGVYHAGGTGRAVNTLFARNVAGSGLGAALYLNSPGGVQILFATIASPTVAGGSAIEVAGGIVGITDTIIASHTIGISQTGGTVYEDYNLLFANSSPLSGTVASGGHSLSGDPSFGAPFADNYHLQPGSAAIDNGINAGITSDLDGNPRPRGIAFDIGAYEAPFMPPVVFIPLISN